MPMMPTPMMPHSVDVVHRDAEGLRGRVSPRADGAHGGDVVAGDRLRGRRDQRLHFLVLVGRDAVDRLRLEARPSSRCGAEPDSSTCSAGAVPELVRIDRDRGFGCRPKRARSAGLRGR